MISFKKSMIRLLFRRTNFTKLNLSFRRKVFSDSSKFQIGLDELNKEFEELLGYNEPYSQTEAPRNINVDTGIEESKGQQMNNLNNHLYINNTQEISSLSNQSFISKVLLIDIFSKDNDFSRCLENILLDDHNIEFNYHCIENVASSKLILNEIIKLCLENNSNFLVIRVSMDIDAVFDDTDSNLLTLLCIKQPILFISKQSIGGLPSAISAFSSMHIETDDLIALFIRKSLP